MPLNKDIAMFAGRQCFCRFLDDFNSNFFATMHECVVIDAEIGKH